MRAACGEFSNQGVELGRDEGACDVQAAVQVERGNQRLVPIRQQCVFSPAAGFLFAATEQQVILELEALGPPRQRGR